jgi:signal transduction histidine kinase
MVAISLTVNGHVQNSIVRVVTASEFWAPKFREVSTLGILITAVNAPGNEVFNDGDVAGARARMATAQDSLDRQLALLRRSLPDGLRPADSAEVHADLDHVGVGVEAMRAHAETVFVQFRAGRVREAARHMARMDGEFNRTLLAVRHLRADVSAAQDELILAQRAATEASSRLLRFASLAMLLLAVGGGWLGFRLAREAHSQAEAREATMAELRAAHQELESFSYSVAHDLRAPLRSIAGFSEALVEDNGPRLDPQGRGHLEKIQGASARMSALIEDLLNLSRVTRQPLATMPLDLTAMAHEVVAELRAQDPGREVAVTIAPGLRTEADRSLTRALLQNLLGNAWKFTRRADAARIEFGREAGSGPHPDAFFVRDNGAGFDNAYAAKLFGAFQRLHATGEFEGTGVGLATVRRIVRRHGGEVWGEGKVGAGATFHFTLRG